MTKKRESRKRRRRRFGSVFRRPGGSGWLARYPDPSGHRTPCGRRANKTYSARTKAEAEAFLDEVEKEILKGGSLVSERPDADACELTLLEAIDEYIESKRGEGRAESGILRYEISRRAIAHSSIAAMRVVDLTPREIERYQGWRRNRKWRGVRAPGTKRHEPNTTLLVEGAKCSPSTVNRDLALISAAIQRLIRLKLHVGNPAKAIKRAREPRKALSILSKDECARLLAACDPHLYYFCLAAIYTGARPSELRRATWSDVSFDNGTLTIYRTKVSLGDAIPMHPDLACALERLLRNTQRRRIVPLDEHVFLSSRGRPNWDHRYSWSKALRKAGLDGKKGITLYSLRHSFGTHFIEHGSPADLQQIMGHASFATTERYVRAITRRARRDLASMSLSDADAAQVGSGLGGFSRATLGTESTPRDSRTRCLEGSPARRPRLLGPGRGQAGPRPSAV